MVVVADDDFAGLGGPRRTRGALPLLGPPQRWLLSQRRLLRFLRLRPTSQRSGASQGRRNPAGLRQRRSTSLSRAQPAPALRKPGAIHADPLRSVPNGQSGRNFPDRPSGREGAAGILRLFLQRRSHLDPAAGLIVKDDVGGIHNPKIAEHPERFLES